MNNTVGTYSLFLTLTLYQPYLGFIIWLCRAGLCLDEATEEVLESLRDTENVFVTRFEKAMRMEMEFRFMEYGQRSVIVQYLYELLSKDGKKESTRQNIPDEAYRRVINELLIDKNNKIVM